MRILARAAAAQEVAARRAEHAARMSRAAELVCDAVALDAR